MRLLYCVYVVFVFLVLLIRNLCVSQYHQDDYDIIHDRIDATEVNKTAIPFIQLKMYIYNETLKIKVLNLTVNFKTGARKNIILTVVVFKNVRNIYRPLPIPHISIDICEEFANLKGPSNPLGIKGAIAKSNFRGCPTRPGIYYVDSWLIEQDKFLPHAPTGEYKLAVHAVFDDDIFAVDAEYYGAVVKKKKNRKH